MCCIHLHFRNRFHVSGNTPPHQTYASKASLIKTKQKRVTILDSIRCKPSYSATCSSKVESCGTVLVLGWCWWRWWWWWWRLRFHAGWCWEHEVTEASRVTSWTVACHQPLLVMKGVSNIVQQINCGNNRYLKNKKRPLPCCEQGQGGRRWTRLDTRGRVGHIWYWDRRAQVSDQDSRTLFVTYTYRMCSEVKRWRCPEECAKEQYNTNNTNWRDQNIPNISRIYSKWPWSLSWYGISWAWTAKLLFQVLEQSPSHICCGGGGRYLLNGRYQHLVYWTLCPYRWWKGAYCCTCAADGAICRQLLCRVKTSASTVVLP